MMNKYCPFCDRQNSGEERTFQESEKFYVRWDKNPVSRGHAVVISKKHIDSFFNLKNDELEEMFDMIKKTRKAIDERFHPDGYNIGVNEGKTAGQTIEHLHIHIIPRYKGDVENPRGGVRNVIPGKGDY